jgi:hypothetical protein
MSEMLEKVITTTHIGSGTDGRGLLTTEQSRVFRDYMDDKTVLMPQVRKVAMRADVMDIDRMGIGQRLLRQATEAVDDAINVGVVFSKISLTAVKYRLDWELTEESLEDNIEGRDLEDHIARLMASQIGQDLEDLAINGSKVTRDPLLGGLDGWGALLRHGAQQVDGAAWADEDVRGPEWTSRLMSAMLRKVPRRAMTRRQNLRFMAGGDFVQEHLDNVAAAAAAANNYDPRRELQNPDNLVTGPYGFSTIGNGGVRLHEVPLMYTRDEAEDGGTAAADSYDVWLTDPQNLVWGIRRDITVHREFKPRKDAIEYTVYVRVAAAVENLEAAVIAKNVPAEPTTDAPPAGGGEGEGEGEGGGEG